MMFAMQIRIDSEDEADGPIQDTNELNDQDCLSRLVIE